MTGLMDSPPHVEVAAYILGILNKEDSEAFDRHLPDCPSCQEELRDMFELPDALDVIKRGMKGTTDGAVRGSVNGAGPVFGADRAQPPGLNGALFGGLDDAVPGGPRVNGAGPPTLNGAPLNGTAPPGLNGAPRAGAGPSPDGVVQDLWSPGRRRRSSSGRRHAAPASHARSREELAESRVRRRRALLLGVAAALVVGVTGATASHVLWPSPGTTVAASTPEGSSSPEVKEGTSPDTGVSGSVGMVPKGWGTEVAFRLSGVRGPERCSLVAVGRSGDTDVVSGWRVAPGSGYGVPGFPEPLRLTGGTALARKDIVRFEVRRDDGVRLLEIPVA
ncbi:anti-sigma factor family protein [Sphaerisporangium rhizosphaerae]|uniref:Anti-sigma factor family protein n=1 Tax=Sphaerisporangium rhizosphaerae TaxID=2269375 RepID=A0ABW2PDC8_9ACTN